MMLCVPGFVDMKLFRLFRKKPRIVPEGGRRRASQRCFSRRLKDRALRHKTPDHRVKESTMNKAIVSILGADRIGIIAAVSGYLAENDINILDISQTIMDRMFTMVTMVDLSGSPKPFDVIYDDLRKLGETLGVVIQIQKTEIFDSMHKV